MGLSTYKNEYGSRVADLNFSVLILDSLEDGNS